METQRRNILPEGVGKKIVDALKQQNVNINEIQNNDQNNNFNINENNYSARAAEVETGEKQDFIWDNYEVSEEQPPSDSGQNTEYYEYAEETKEEDNSYEFYEEITPSVAQNIAEPKVNSFNFTPQNIVSQSQTIQPSQPQKPLTFKQNDRQESLLTSQQEMIQTEFEIPANVEVLKRLITQLPAGVTRQTGAQIIRQTMEAMGLSINTVLSEAQMIQENLGNASKDSVNTIEEYRNNIKILEKKIQNYKKQADQLAELINLFILSENKR